VEMLNAKGIEEYSFKEKQHSMITARKFIAYCVHMGDGEYEFSSFVIPLIPFTFDALRVSEEGSSSSQNNQLEISASDRALEAEVSKNFRYSLAEISSSCLITYDGKEDMTRILNAIDTVSKNPTWQIRQAAAHFLRCFQGCHTFLFSEEQTAKTTGIVEVLLADERREVSSAAMAALTGILAGTNSISVSHLVATQVKVARASIIKKKRKNAKSTPTENGTTNAKNGKDLTEKEMNRAKKQQSSVFFLCAVVLANPYDTPSFVPEALEALSKHSFEHRATLAVRDTVKKVFSEFKRTHMNDNWEVHRKQFNREQLEALEDVVSTPHYYA